MNYGQLQPLIWHTLSQNYTNMVVGKHGIQTFEVVMLLFLLSKFDVLIPKSAHPLLFFDKWIFKYTKMSICTILISLKY